MKTLLLRLLAFLMILVGLSLTVGGAMLIYYDGSPFYLPFGLGMLLSGSLIWQKKQIGAWLYLLVFAAIVAWGVWEAGLDFWGMVPRLLGPLFLAALALLFIPLFPRERYRQPPSKLFIFTGFILLAGFAGYIGAMFFPQARIHNPVPLTSGEITQTTLDVGNNWMAWGRTGSGSRYAPFDQITPENVNDLEIAWTARTGFIARQDVELQDQNTPLFVDGTLYQCAAAGQITALDGDTGKIHWQFDPKAQSDDWKRCRALAYFDPGPGDSCGPRIIETTVDARLISVKTRDGKPCETFGNNGTVNLWDGMGETNPQFLTNSSGAVVANGNIILGGRVTDNMSTEEPSGAIRAYDALTGNPAWVWDLGNPELSFPLKPGEKLTVGTPNAWAPLSYDETLGMVYIPTGNAPPDIYGGERRPFDDAYNSSVVALDSRTGKEIWKFQTTHHDLWDYDLPSQPVLADIPDGKGGTIPGLVQTTKRSQLFVLDRRTGEPIKKVEEKPVPQGDGRIEGEYYAETQPYSVEMAAPGADPLTEKAMWGATIVDQMMCRILFHKYNYQGDFTPPGLDYAIINPGMLGGMNYGSTTIDEQHNIMVAVAMRMPMIQKLVPRSNVTSDMKYTGESGPFAPMDGTPYALQRGIFMSPIGIPCQQPPWGIVSAIDLASGKEIWRQPAGTAKDLSVAGIKPNLPFYIGMPPLGGPMISKGGIAWHGGFQDYYLRAYNVVSGDILWEGRLPTGAQSTPMSYIGKDGRQYIVISASGARDNPSDWGDYIVAFALPKNKVKN